MGDASSDESSEWGGGKTGTCKRRARVRLYGRGMCLQSKRVRQLGLTARNDELELKSSTAGQDGNKKGKKRKCTVRGKRAKRRGKGKRGKQLKTQHRQGKFWLIKENALE